MYEVIKDLSKRHEIYLVTRVEKGELQGLEEIRPFCKEVYPYTYATSGKRGLFGVIGLILNYIGFGLFARRLTGRGFDLIQAEWVESAVFLKKGGTPMVLDSHDVITKPAERLFRQACLPDRQGRGISRYAGFFRYAAVRTLERMIVERFNVVFTRSGYDRDYLLAMAPGIEVVVVPHPAGLDITDREYGRSRNTILFLASYKYRRVNVEAALYFYREVFPLVRLSVPAAKFVIAGYGPPEELTSLQEKDTAVSVPGFVEDIDECYKRAAVFVAPILVGGGIIVKVLDAMAAGTPVVTTTFGNEGIGATPGRDLLTADDAGSFAGAVVEVLQDEGLAAALSKNGREFVGRKYSRDAVMDKIESAYERLVKGCPTY